jgi:hypothetical protein
MPWRGSRRVLVRTKCAHVATNVHRAGILVAIAQVAPRPALRTRGRDVLVVAHGLVILTPFSLQVAHEIELETPEQRVNRPITGGKSQRLFLKER